MQPRIEVAVAAPAPTVWRALRDPAQLRRWFGWDAEGLGDEIEEIFVAHAIADDEARTLRFDDIPDRFEIEPRGADASLLRLFAATAAGDAYDGMQRAGRRFWRSFALPWNAIPARTAGPST